MPIPETWGEAIEAFKADKLAQGISETTWTGDYWKILKRLPSGDRPSAEALKALVVGTTPNTKTRQRACFVVATIAQFLGLDYDPSRYRGRYSPRRPQPRDIPSDEAISEYWASLTNPQWAWFFGAMATYGLRNHEVFHLDLESLQQDPILWVLAGKTGARRVRPLHPEWYERFWLFEALPPSIDLNRCNSALGHSAISYFRDLPTPPPFGLYSLRHAYALRGIRYGLNPTAMARMMGHSRAVHESIYQLWLDEAAIGAEYDRALARSDRPQPP